MSTYNPDADALFWARMGRIIERSVAGLDEADRAARVAQCRASGAHGVTVHAEGPDRMRLEWGGATLAVVDLAVFTDDAYFADLDVTFLPTALDDLSSLDGEPLC